MGSYKLGQVVEMGLRAADPAVTCAVQQLHTIDFDAYANYEPIDFGNGKLRTLADHTVTGKNTNTAGWASLLWVPPSLPYLEPDGPYAGRSGSVTKQLVFSEWQATPPALASLLSYEAERTMLGGRANTYQARRALTSRLQYRASDERGLQSMTTLMLFWPIPELARAGDPLVAAQAAGGPVSAQEAERRAAEQIGWLANRSVAEDGQQPWQAYFSWPGIAGLDIDQVAETVQAADAEGDGESGIGQETSAFRKHAAWARQLQDTGGKYQDPWLARLAMHAPGNIAYRALRRVTTEQDTYSPVGLWLAARRVANGIRALFSRPEAAGLLDQLAGSQNPYWQRILRYCADGNLQAVLDEHVFALRSQRGPAPLTDDALREIADAMCSALMLKPLRLTAQDPAGIADSGADSAVRFRARFAMRYSVGKRASDDAAPADVQQAFNSPFWPFVLVTTSAGQEGIDFHWWAHSVWHWNVPTNPVDFEQREGRVHRYMGHAIRKNVADRHGASALAAELGNPWAAMFRAAAREDDDEFAPYWVYPGNHKIERHLIDYPLSRDTERTREVLSKLALYRMTLGQPRQDDLLRFLRGGPERPTGLDLDLRP